MHISYAVLFLLSWAALSMFLDAFSVASWLRYGLDVDMTKETYVGVTIAVRIAFGILWIVAIANVVASVVSGRRSTAS